MSRNKMSEDDKKSKIQITININLLNEIDKIIKNTGDKRSRFIEILVKKYIDDHKIK